MELLSSVVALLPTSSSYVSVCVDTTSNGGVGICGNKVGFFHLSFLLLVVVVVFLNTEVGVVNVGTVVVGIVSNKDCAAHGGG